MSTQGDRRLALCRQPSDVLDSGDGSPLFFPGPQIQPCRQKSDEYGPQHMEVRPYAKPEHPEPSPFDPGLDDPSPEAASAGSSAIIPHLIQGFLQVYPFVSRRIKPEPKVVVLHSSQPILRSIAPKLA